MSKFLVEELKEERGDFTILMVDDDATNLQVLGNCLKPQGYRLLQAMNGKRALEICQRAKPDLVLLDVNMPVMNGYETCRALKADPELAQIPVIFLSAYKDVENKVQGFQAGGVDYVDKPFNYDELLARVDTHLALKVAMEKVNQKSEEVESLLRVLSHDLMNPISAMSGFSQLAAQLPTYQDPDTRECWENVREALVQQEAIIENVRVMRALESGKRRVALGPVNVRDVLVVSQGLFSRQLEAKGLTLEVAYDKTLDYWVRAEKVSLTHDVMNNLLSNAIKFSLRGSLITVRVSQKGKETHLAVIDRGIGIPANLINKIFSSSKPTSRPGTEAETGTGFGMPLIKKYVQLYGGKILVESTTREESPTGHGSTFTVILHTSSPDEEPEIFD